MTSFYHWRLETKKGKDKLKKFLLSERDRKICSNLANKRLAKCKEKGFFPGCRIRYIIGKGVICQLKGITEDGFLVIVGSNNRENPKFWELITEE